jgi:hypothetical protein
MVFSVERCLLPLARREIRRSNRRCRFVAALDVDPLHAFFIDNFFNRCHLKL